VPTARDAATDVISALPLAQRIAAEKTGSHSAASRAVSAGLGAPPAIGERADDSMADGQPTMVTGPATGSVGESIGEPGDGEVETTVAPTPWIRRRKNLGIVLGGVAGVGLVTAGLAWGLHSKAGGTSTPVGVVPVTGQTADQSGGLVSGGKPADPPPATGPQFAPDGAASPPAPVMPPPGALPPDPYAGDPALKAPPPPPAMPAPAMPPPAMPPPAMPAPAMPAPGAPNSQTTDDGLPPDTLSDDLGDQSRSGQTGFDDPSFGPSGAAGTGQPRYRSDTRRYGPGGYRGPDRSNGPLGPLGDNDHNGGPRRGPVDDAVPGIGGLGH
jgi:hypothetical protein